MSEQLALVDDLAREIRGSATPGSPAASPDPKGTGEAFNPAIHAVDSKTGQPIRIKGGGFRKKPVFKSAPFKAAPPSAAPAGPIAPAAPVSDLPPGAPVFTPAAALPPPAPAAPEPPKVAPEVAARRFLKLANMFLKGPLALSEDEKTEWEAALTEKFTDDGSAQFRSGLVLWFLSGCYVFDRWEALKARFSGKKPAPATVSEPKQTEEPPPLRRQTVPTNIPSVLSNPSSIS